MYHPHVPHPRDFLETSETTTSRFSALVARVASSVLGSMIVFWVTFIVPLVSIPASDSIKLLVSILFSSWFQAWALPVLQGAANRADLKRDAKADADHEALVSLHAKVDAIGAAVLQPPPITPDRPGQGTWG